MQLRDELRKRYDGAAAYKTYCRYRSSRLQVWRDRSITTLIPLVGRLVFNQWKDLSWEDRDDIIGEGCLVISRLVRSCQRDFPSELEFTRYFWRNLRDWARHWKESFEWKHYPRKPIEDPIEAIHVISCADDKFESIDRQIDDSLRGPSSLKMASSMVRFQDPPVFELCCAMLERLSVLGFLPRKSWSAFSVPPADVPFYLSYCTLLYHIAEKRVGHGVTIGNMVSDVHDAVAFGMALLHPKTVLPELLQVLGFEKMLDFVSAFNGGTITHLGYTFRIPKHDEYLVFLAEIDIYLALSKRKNKESTFSDLCNRYELNEDEIRTIYRRIEKRMNQEIRETFDRG